MSFALQYHKDGKFQPVLRYPTVTDAMAAAIGLAQASNYSPLRILNKNAAVIVSGKRMAEFLEATPDQQKEMMRQQGIITKAAEEMRKRKGITSTLDISEALIIETPDGSKITPYTVVLNRSHADGTCTATVETPGNGLTPITFDTETGIITSAAWQGHKVVNDPNGFSVEFPEDPKAAMTLYWTNGEGGQQFETFPNLDEALNAAGVIHGRGHTLDKLLNSWGEEATPQDQLRAVGRMRCNEIIRKALHKVETDAMEASPLWGAW